MGKSVAVRLDNGEINTYKIPKYETEEAAIKAVENMKPQAEEYEDDYE